MVQREADPIKRKGEVKLRYLNVRGANRREGRKS